MCSAAVRGQAVLRFVVCSRLTRSEDVLRSWAEIVTQAEAAALLLDEASAGVQVPAPAPTPVPAAADRVLGLDAKTGNVVHMLGASAGGDGRQAV